MIWYFIRHGEIQSNVDKVYAGWSDEALTERGVCQAEKAGETLRGKGIDKIYCSPLRRAVQTAEIIGKAVGRVPIVDEHFKEMGMGPWEGLSEDEVEKKFPEEWRVWNAKPGELRLDGRETLGELQVRVLEGVRRQRSEVGGQRSGKIVVVTHVAIIRVLMLYSEGRDLNEYKQVPVPGNGEVFEIDPQITQICAD